MWIFTGSYKVNKLMFSKGFWVIVLKVAKSPECKISKNDVRAHAVVGQYSVSGGPLKGPGGPNGPPVCYLKYALPVRSFPYRCNKERTLN